MRMLMLPAHVTLKGRQPVLVSWREGAPRAPVPAVPPTPSVAVHGGTAPVPAGARPSARPAPSPQHAQPRRTDAGRLHQRPVARVLDRWRYDGRWWEREVHRDYLLLELRGGGAVELFREGDAWWVARAND